MYTAVWSLAHGRLNIARMAVLLIFSTTEHLLVLSAFLFPPVLIIILLVILLATFGKSLGLRERYVSILNQIFEWGAGEIKSSQNDNKKMSFELGASDCEEEDYGLLEYSDAGHYCSLDLSSTQSPTDSGFMPDSPLARSANSLSSLRKCSSVLRNGSSTSLCSASSAGRMRHSSGQSIIIRETAIHLDEDEYTEKTMVNSRGWQVIRDSLYFMKAGVEAIIEDEVTSRFQAEQLASWNMLTRTSINFCQFVNWKLTMLWVLGFLFRYFFLLPMGLIIFSVSLITVVFGTAVIGIFPKGRLKQWMNEKLMLVCMRIASRAFSAPIYFHDTENKAKSGAICVANHTSPIDVMILGTDAVYALIGQCHSGFLGAIQRALSRASSHIWFERSEAKDRSLVARRIYLMKILLIVIIATLQLDYVSGQSYTPNPNHDFQRYFISTPLKTVLNQMTTEISVLKSNITEMDKKMAVMNTEFEAKITALDTKMDKIDKLDEKIDKLDAKVDSKFDAFQSKFDAFQSKFENVYNMLLAILCAIFTSAVTIAICIYQCPRKKDSPPSPPAAVQVLPKVSQGKEIPRVNDPLLGDENVENLETVEKGEDLKSVGDGNGKDKNVADRQRVNFPKNQKNRGKTPKKLTRMTALLLFSTTEHLLVLSAFLFPPVLIIIMLVILLATFGKSLGLRERYWGAGEIKSSQNDNKKMSFELGASDCEEEDYGLLEYSDAGHYCSLDLSSAQSPTDSGFMPDSPLARSANSLSSLRKCSSVVRNGSSTSLCSASSAGRMRHSSGQSIIIRETAIHLDEDEYTEKTMVNSRGWQVIRDSLYFMKAGVEAIIEDEVTSRFQAEQLASWNMLTRTSINFCQFVNWKLTMLWVLGFLFRYFFLLPMRLIVFSVSLITVVFGTAVIGIFPKGRLKQWMNEKLMLVCMRIASRAFSALIYFHDTENKAKSGAICVANHTSPIDVMILGTDAVYALIGQCHSGFLGAIQRALSRASSHIWFERSEAKDRSLVARRLHEHVQDPNKLPVLIFPEGTCINNTSVMMFKKGCFEVDATIYPIAMKYDSRFGDAFWNSSEQSYFEYMLQMMTSWALICHVWYLPPMRKEPNESTIDFANRVKKAIAIRGGLVDLEWDGGLKRSKVPAKMVDLQRERYYQRYQRYTSFSEPPPQSPPLVEVEN